jgi:hypothetical protein
MSDDCEVVKPRTGDVDILDLVPCVALGCCIASLYTEIPDCCGSVLSNVICCIGCKILTCKPSKEADSFCKCLSTDCDIVPFATCCKVSGAVEASLSFVRFFLTILSLWVVFFVLS